MQRGQEGMDIWVFNVDVADVIVVGDTVDVVVVACCSCCSYF